MNKWLLMAATIMLSSHLNAKCTKGDADMREAYATMVNLNGELCGKLLEICSTAKKDTYLLHCKFYRDPAKTGTGMYLYNSKTGRVAKSVEDYNEMAK